jgi:hypothetical protein
MRADSYQSAVANNENPEIENKNPSHIRGFYLRAHLYRMVSDGFVIYLKKIIYALNIQTARAIHHQALQ